MRHFKTLLWKEIKSIIRDPKMLLAMFIVPLVMIAVMYGAMSHMVRASIEEAKRVTANVAVIDLDEDQFSEELIKYLRSIGVSVTLYSTKISPYEIYRDKGIKITYIVPRNFTESIMSNKTAYINVYIVLTGLSFTEFGIIGKAESVIFDFAKNVSRQIAVRYGINYEFLEKPVNTTVGVYVGDRLVEGRPEALMGVIMASSVFVPVILLMMITMLVQFAATSMAVEKEEKMLETLLSLPVNRMTIIGVKILVPIIISLGYAAIYGVILLYYLLSMTSPTPGQSLINITIPREILGYAGASIMGCMLLALGLALLTSMFSEDVRTAQMFSSYIIAPLFMAIFIPMFVDVGSLGIVKTVLALIPILNTAIIPKYAFLGYNTEVYIASFINFVYAFITLYLITKFVTTEKIFTARIFVRRRIR